MTCSGARTILVALLASSALNAGAADELPPCSPTEAQTAWAATAAAQRSWVTLHDQYVAYGDARACAQKALSNGWSDAVMHLLGKRWSQLPVLAQLVERDPGFLEFVLKHIDGATDYPSIRRVAKNASASCPAIHEKLCERIRSAADAQLEQPGVFHSVVGGIGDDTCALMLRIEATIADPGGSPVEGAEVWVLDQLQPMPPTARASRFGVTDAHGQLSALDCYMGHSDFMFWSPEKDPVHLEFFVVRQGFGVERLSVSPPLAEVLAAGSLVTTKPGEYATGYNGVPEWRGRAYAVKVPVVLHRVADP